LFALFLVAPSLAHADGYFSFANLSIPGDRLSLGSTYDNQAGLVFTVMPYGNGQPGDLGFVRSNALWYCIDPLINHVMLGTADQGTGSIGDALYPIRIDFAQPLVPPAVVHVQVQTKWSMDVLITLYDAQGNAVGASGGWWSGAANLVEGSCGPGDATNPKYMNGIWGAWSATAVNYAVVSMAAPYTIESLDWLEHVVATEPVTWGHVKSLYRDK
jgi:hypothetical protein